MADMGSEPTMAASVRRAEASDAAAIATLVNRAYQVERFFVDGDRTDAAEVAALCARGEVFVLDGPDGAVVAAIHVHARRADDSRGDGVGEFGMLSVAPGFQGHGLGKRLIAVAEAYCAAMGCTAMGLHVVNLRSELEAWYRSLGYRPVATAPYLHRAAKQACHFVVMQKPLAQSMAA
jgi:GNAT superfamily N-acetyltransferase